MNSRRLATVVLPVKLHKELCYSIPDELTHHIRPGQRVIVPLRGRTCVGYVTAIGGSYDGEVKPIVDVAEADPSMTPEVFKLCTWISEYYAAPLGEVIRCSGGIEHIRYRTIGTGGESSLTGLRAEIFKQLATRPQNIASLALVLGRKQTLATVLDLVEEGLLTPVSNPEKKQKGPAGDASALSGDPLPPLSVEQRQAVERILEAMGRFTPILLHGVTASGKTRVYMEAIFDVWRRGKTALYLVPEIAMTFILEKEFDGKMPFCVIHSQLSPVEKSRRLAGIHKGHYPLVIGTRSALFSPLPHLGLIIVDEEHDSAYKQEERVRYHARDAAVMRAKFQDIPIVLGSATPSLETYFLGSVSRYVTLTMKTRIADRVLPSARIVDMRRSKEGFLSDDLKQAVRDRLQKGEQSILLLNRRGYAPFLICTHCGTIFRCTNCQVSMVFHKEDDCFLCHYCGTRRPQPQACAECKDNRLLLVGEGTEKALESLQQIFAGYRVERLDSDVATSPTRTRRVLQEFAAGDIHILVGTQMLAKGHHFPQVTLVGILSMDHLLGFPDFRAAERVFQLVTQVSGRSGRGNVAGEVIIQTRFPEHYALKCGCNQNYEQFFSREIQYRKALSCPPFSSLILITCRDVDKARAARRGRSLEEIFKRFSKEGVDVVGPVFAALPKIRKKWRVNLLLKGEKKPLRETLRRALRFAEANKISLGDYTIDVDPVDLM